MNNICSRCGRKSEDLQTIIFETFNADVERIKEEARFCARCWFACAFAIEREANKSIRNYFFPLSKWDNLKKVISK